MIKSLQLRFLSSLLVSLTVLASNGLKASESKLREIGDYYGIAIASELESRQVFSLDSEFTNFFNTSRDLTRDNADQFGRKKPHQILAFRAYLQKLVDGGHLTADHSLVLLKTALIGATEGAMPPIVARHQMILSQPYRATDFTNQIITTQAANGYQTTNQAVGLSRNTRQQSHQALNHSSDLYFGISTGAVGAKIYAGTDFIGRATGVGLAISAGDLRNKTIYQSGDLVLSNTLLDDRFGGETRQSSISADYRIGLRSGEFNDYLMTGTETRVGLDYGISRMRIHDSPTYIAQTITNVDSLDAVVSYLTGNSANAFVYQGTTPTDRFGREISHSLTFYFPYEMIEMTNNYAGIGFGWGVDHDEGTDWWGILFELGAIAPVTSH